MNTVETALIISELDQIATALRDVLAGDDIPVRLRTPAEVLAHWSTADGGPDLLLVNAEIEIGTVTKLARHIVAVSKHSPTVVAFTDSDFSRLMPHIEAGLDYLVPPFLPHLVRSRLMACRQRQELVKAAEEVEAAASLSKYEREMAIGREIQRDFLPDALPTLPDWELAARFEPARKVGGDFYDSFPLLAGTRIGMVIADVCDKGVGAALFMALIRSLVRQAAMTATGGSPAEVARNVVTAVNAYLTDNHGRQAYFATLFFGLLDPVSGRMDYVNCGHNPPVLRRADGTSELLEPTGPAVGLTSHPVYRTDQVTVLPGDTVFLHTDGVTEAKNPEGSFFGDGRLYDLIAQTQGIGGNGLLDLVAAALRGHISDADQFDDITMMSLHRRP
jgi:sigma-B regulation protein RsbU (phosphoserine phosphatase)